MARPLRLLRASNIGRAVQASPRLLKASQVQRVQLCDRYPHDAIALRDRVSVMRLGDCDSDTRVIVRTGEEAGLPSLAQPVLQAKVCSRG
jgi:hypothetical protein